jgi:translation initiation factor IF-2
MAGMTVRQFATLVNLPVDRLLSQFKDAGLKPATADSEVSPAEKIKLLEFLRTSHGKTASGEGTRAPSQITLKRKTVNEIQVQPASSGVSKPANKTVSVEVRQKRTYVQPQAGGAPASTEMDPERAEALRKLGESKLRQETAEMQRREAEMKQAAEAKAQAARAAVQADAEPKVEASRTEAAGEASPARTETAPDNKPETRSDAPRPYTRPDNRGTDERPRTGGFGDRPRTGFGDRPQGDRPPRTGGFGDRPQGDRPPRTGGFGDRPQGDRPPRTGGFGDRPQGDRPPRTGGFGDRPQGDRPPRTGGFGDRPQGDRPPRTGGFGDRPPGDRPPRPAGTGFPPRTGGPGMGPRPGGPGFGAPIPGPAGKRPAPKAGAAQDRDRDKKPGKNAAVKGKTGQFSGVEFDESSPSYDLGQLHLADGASRRPKKRKPQKEVRQSNVATGPHGFSKPAAPVSREVAIGDTITVGELASLITVKTGDVIKALMRMGVMATINQVIEHDTAVLVAEELGHKVTMAEDTDIETTLANVHQEGEDLESRPPVVTIMGHVDHGKTSLLDYIRRTKVAAGEAGGITQHVGAYHVTTKKGVVTFLDTPGHAAFTQMRARGAKLTDIVVLVVAADDGVMPQTIEAIKHSKAAGVPMIVAVNKMDKADADPERVKQGLLQHEVVPEEYGGDVLFVPVSAKTGMGVDDLLDNISVQAEVMELRASASGKARGTVVESSLDKGRGSVATVLVQSGTLRKGDMMLCGTQWGRVRAMYDEAGRLITEAGPSIPAVVVGLQGTPNAGDDFMVLADERMARDAALVREHKLRDQRLARQSVNKIEDMFTQMAANDVKTLNILVKADVQGSVEALRESLIKLSTDEVKVNVISSGVGGITETDATLATASKALVIGFNVRADAAARKVMTDGGVKLSYYSIIYEAIDHVRGALTGLLGTEIKEQILGIAQVRDVFRSSKFGAVAGCMVVEGQVKRNKPIRVLRDNVVVFQGELESLRRFKELVDDVRNGMECGIAVKQYNDVKVGDQIECFDRIEVARSL